VAQGVGPELKPQYWKKKASLGYIARPCLKLKRVWKEVLG
jgi:hypothetical protein